jgi:hypothetical protein
MSYLLSLPLRDLLEFPGVGDAASPDETVAGFLKEL